MAVFSHPDDDITLYETGFEEDLFGRRVVGERLSEVVRRFNDPLVIALDGRWGTGKSVFLKKWVGEHKKAPHDETITVYFDAFANDYLADPLVALTSALLERYAVQSSQLQPSKVEKLKAAGEKIFRYSKPLAKIALSVASAGVTTQIEGLTKVAVEAAEGEVSGAIDSIWTREENRKTAMSEFRQALEDCTKDREPSDPSAEDITKRRLVFVVDELDRCRPDFALEVLEVIKHFFSVSNVHFVLGVNLTALENSVKARYGEGIDATAYLQKFLSFKMSLPSKGEGQDFPTTLVYLMTIGQKMGLHRNILEELRTQLRIVSQNNHVSIRDVSKILSLSALLPIEAQENTRVDGYRKTAISLLISKVVAPEIYQKLVSVSLTQAELERYLGVTSQLIDRDPTKDNPLYNNELHSLFNMWLFLLSDGETPWQPQSEGEAGQFGNHPSRAQFDFRARQFKEIPATLDQTWLGVFEYTT
ncbi:KAP family P-loop NTPase fold protein [Thioclava kandeliae]|uniref:P-loop NTPase fold protein n=1 Tax=Thioclava kandeliae TaxID=3070818 RepID=A0ABV1SH32_9RHOB